MKASNNPMIHDGWFWAIVGYPALWGVVLFGTIKNFATAPLADSSTQEFLGRSAFSIALAVALTVLFLNFLCMFAAGEKEEVVEG